jgi:hypothetical protein
LTKHTFYLFSTFEIRSRHVKDLETERHMLARALAAKDEDVKRLQKESRPLRAELERTQVRLYELIQDMHVTVGSGDSALHHRLQIQRICAHTMTLSWI